jgi:hypothetical protein
MIRKEAGGRPANQEPVLRHFLSSGLVVGALLVSAGCGGSAKQASPAGTGSATTATVTTTSTGSTNTLEGAATTPVVGQAAGHETALLERIAVGRHEGYDRVVFQFRNDLPGYRVEYVQPPLKEDGSGNPVEIQGGAIVLVRMEPASGFDLGTPGGVMVYKGPKRIQGSSAGTSVVRELVRTGDFEAVLSWAVGLTDKVDFRVRTATSPSRLIVDFRSH